MTQDAASAPAQQFTIGNVLGTSFAVLGRNIVAFGVLALGLGVLSLSATLAGAGYMVWTVGSGEASHQILPMILAGVGIFVVFIVVGNLLTATVSYGVFQDLRGQPAGLGGCLARGVASILPVIVASLLFSFLVGLGFILLVVPGVILLLACWLYVPVIVVEKRGIVESLRRSAFLTRGRRWRMFGLWLVVGIASNLSTTVLEKVAAAVIGDWGGAVVYYVWYSATTAFMAVMTAVSYYYLRADKEGVAIDDIAAVFD
jgi:hypothetical protein